MKRFSRFGFIVWGLVVLFGISANAHSYLDDTDPPLGTSLEDSPAELILYFSQSIDPSFGYFRLVDASGEQLIEFEPNFDSNDETVMLPLDEPLVDGQYRIAWQIMSSVDGHITDGIVPFSIGVESEAEVDFNLQGTAHAPGIDRVVVRWLSYLSMLVLVGSLFFTLLLSAPLGTAGFGAKRWTALIWTALGVFFVAELFDVLMQASAVHASLPSVLLDSQWGMARLGKLLFAGSIALLSLLNPNDVVRLWASRAAGILMIVVHARASHNAGLIGDVGFVLDAVHLLAAALWLGGLVQLALIWLPRSRAKSAQERVERLAGVISRFSQMALISVILILGSGIYTATFHIPSWGALFGSLYGQALIMKVVLMLIVIGIACANRFHFVPQIANLADQKRSKSTSKLSSESVAGALTKFRRLASVEALTLVVILIFAGVMTTASPPHEHTARSTLAEPIVSSQHLEDAFVELVVNPLENGERVIDVRVENHDGSPIEGVLRVWIETTYLDEDFGGIVIDPIAEPTENPGLYRITGPYLNIEGSWQVEVIVRISGRAEDVKAMFEISTATRQAN